MANNVNTYFQFYRISEEGKAKFAQLCSRLSTNPQEYHWFSDMWGIDKSVTETIEWNYNNIGPKWSYVDEYGDDYLRITSAWDYPEAGLEWLVKQIAEVDTSVVAAATYEDEMPNFAGASVFDADGLFDNFHADDARINEEMIARYPELKNRVEDQLDEHLDDIWSDNIWDCVYDLQQKNVDAELNFLLPGDDDET